jgi:hypothetical protein
MLYDGKVKLLANHTICNEGDVLTASQAQLLKLLGFQMAKFQITIRAIYDKEAESVIEL